MKIGIFIRFIDNELVNTLIKNKQKYKSNVKATIISMNHHK